MLRKIVIDKSILFKGIDALTYKMSEVGMAESSDEVKDGTASDQYEKLDASLLNSFADLRDARLREILAFCMVDTPVYELSNKRDTEDCFVYLFEVPDNYTPAMMRSTFNYINEYLQKGVLLDWYKNINSQLANNYVEDVATLEYKVMESLRPSFVEKAIDPLALDGRFYGRSR